MQPHNSRTATSRPPQSSPHSEAGSRSRRALLVRVESGASACHASSSMMAGSEGTGSVPALDAGLSHGAAFGFALHTP